MLRFNACYSKAKELKRARKMQQQQKVVKAFKATLADYWYIATSLVIAFSVLSQYEIQLIPRGTLTAQASETTRVESIKIEKVVEKVDDDRPVKLQQFLESKNSPLAPHSKLIVEEADKYGLDWTKIVAVSAIESQYGTKLPKNSFNAWGIGGARFFYFGSWEEGIKYASKLLGENYKINENSGIKTKYCPSSDGCNPQWANIVTKASQDILAWEGK